MFENVQHNFVFLAPGGQDPSQIPADVRECYDEFLGVVRKFPHFGANTKAIHANFWPVVCMLAKLHKRIGDLEKMRSGGIRAEAPPRPDPPPLAEETTTNNPGAVLDIVKVEPDPVPIPERKKVDKRTKAYKDSMKAGKDRELAGVV